MSPSAMLVMRAIMRTSGGGFYDPLTTEIWRWTSGNRVTVTLGMSFAVLGRAPGTGLPRRRGGELRRADVFARLQLAVCALEPADDLCAAVQVPQDLAGQRRL